jgi:hypothetical protein
MKNLSSIFFFFFTAIISFLLFFFLLYYGRELVNVPGVNKPPWNVESIDTMKYSRDLARQAETNPQFNSVINAQMAQIKSTGANYVAIDTPYDPEFLPVLIRWVKSARAHNLHVWFRGNFSGWEQWFGYPPITMQMHTADLRSFILNNPGLFADGDIFTSCPECENGDHLDLSSPSAIFTHRQFLLSEYAVASESFNMIHKNVITNFYSMNKDVAVAVMDRQTTAQLGGVVVIDHYVATPEKLAMDIKKLSALSGGNIVLGEFGVPIPDINGSMTDAQQAQWIKQAMGNLVTIPSLVGVNYWTSMGGSTALWNLDNSPKPAVSVIRQYYKGKY